MSATLAVGRFEVIETRDLLSVTTGAVLTDGCGRIGCGLADLIADMQNEGHALTGPHPADTLFHAAARQRYDAAIAMYHDQALIPIKTLDFDKGVNVTLGLPFIRTSPDHGTAFDIAGQGLATPSSLIEALRLAQSMAATRAG